MKRYKYNGKERDEETGLDYYGARYYASWLCRFVSVDPQKDNYPMQNSFAYAANSPVTMVDVNGEGPGKTGDQYTVNRDEDGYITNIVIENFDNVVSDKEGNLVSGSYTVSEFTDIAGLEFSEAFANLPDPMKEALAGEFALGGFRPQLQFQTPLQQEVAFGNAMRGRVQPSTQEQSSSSALDYFQTGLDIVGLVPGFGEAADGLNALIYLGRGDYANAALSAAAMVPLAGAAATAGKLISKHGDEVIDLYRTVSKAELDDIAEFGIRNKEGAYDSGKLFATSAEDASNFGRLNYGFDQETFTIIKTTIDKTNASKLDIIEMDMMDAIPVPKELFNKLSKPKSLNWTPIPNHRWIK